MQTLWCGWGPAYIGPGAGFAFLGSFLMLLAAVGLALAALAALPLRLAAQALRSRRRARARRPRVRRVVVLGLDGLDPAQLRRRMERGELPNFSRLAAAGSCTELRTTCPPMSPVAWSSFLTGVNPGKHGIFDFLNRDLRTRAPQLSSCRLAAAGGRRAELTPLRRSRPFWSVLGEHGVWSTILRVPITFPPEPFAGALLSGMCVPDLRGTQGSFTVFETASPAGPAPTGGERVRVSARGGRIRTVLRGPEVEGRRLEAPLRIALGPRPGQALLRVGGRAVRLCEGVYSDWVGVSFRHGLRRIRGLCRFLLLSTAPEFRLYVTPLHLDPAAPAMPISHPGYFAPYLARLHGPFATLGLAEDTWALNEGVLSLEAFLAQAYDIEREREAMFFEALRILRAGVLVCVFDLADRVQHMCFAAADPALPADAAPDAARGRRAMDDLYQHLDTLLGKTLGRLGPADALFVVSDHGFASFRRGVNLNAWLRQAGYLALRPDAAAEQPYLAAVDWSRTRAYSFGLSGLYLNLQGREAGGLVPPGPAAEALKRELAEGLRALRDPAGGPAPPIRAVYDSAQTFRGPYAGDGPELVVGYAPGYRAAWETAIGRADGEVFCDNPKAWCGDHCIDHELVPGAFLSNARLRGGRPPHIMDLAPTILDLMGVPAPAYMDGQALDLELAETHA